MRLNIILILAIFQLINCTKTTEEALEVLIDIETLQLTRIERGSDFQLVVTVTNGDKKDLTYFSSNEEIATINNTGLVTSKAVGLVTINASLGDAQQSIELEVVSSIFINIDAPELFLPGIGSTLQLTVTVTNGEGSDLTFSSNKEDIATVDKSGLITAKAVGTVTIEANVGDTKKSVFLEIFPVNGLGIEEFDFKFIKKIMRVGGFPGASVAVVKNGKLVFAKGYGYADLDTKEPVTPKSLFRIASVSKPITGVATLKLIEDGDLSLTEKLFDIIPEFLPNDGPADTRILDITIDDLLHHQGGWDRSIVPDPQFRPRDVASDLGVPSPPTAHDYVRWITTQPLQFTPSSMYSYHNFNYMLLGRVIEKKKGSYENYVRNEMFPLMDISETRIGKTRREDQYEGEVTYYALNSSPSNFDESPAFVSNAYGGSWGLMSSKDASGGWVSNVVELSKFAKSIDADPSTQEFLSQTSHAYMITDFGDGYGAGFILASDNFWHNGVLNGGISNLVIFHNGLTYSFLLNTTIIPFAVLTDLDQLIREQAWPNDEDYFSSF